MGAPQYKEIPHPKRLGLRGNNHWDGNGRIARLLANMPLLRAGLPLLTIRADRRREYVQLLTNYDLGTGQLNSATGAWPESGDLAAFTAFCGDCYSAVPDLVAAVSEFQRFLGQSAGLRCIGNGQAQASQSSGWRT